MPHRTSPSDALVEAVRQAGDQTKFARLLNVSQGTVSKWLTKEEGIPAQHVLSVEEHTGISRHDLRPDIYPRDASSAPDASAAHPAPRRANRTDLEAAE